MSRLELFKKNWDPFKELGLAPRNLEKFFDDFYAPQLKRNPDAVLITPSVDVEESKTQYTLKFDLPGIPKDQIKIDLDEKSLTVSGERREERKEEGADNKTHLSEVYYGSFSRSFTFPESVDAEKSEAKYDTGVLTLNIPKKEVSTKRQITVR